ncbi:MAG: HEAT repeat domain-containing protein [Planctomycetota bacterium]
MKTLAVSGFALLLGLSLWLWWDVDPEVTRQGAAPGPLPGPAISLSDPHRQQDALTVNEVPQWTDARAVVRFTESADHGDRDTLRRMALGSENPLVAGNAVRALGRLQAVVSDGALLALIEDPRPRVRQEVVRALGASGDRSAVPYLAQVMEETDAALNDGTDATLRCLAIQALGRLGGREAHALVAAIASDPDASNAERTFAKAALKALEGESEVRRTILSPARQSHPK